MPSKGAAARDQTLRSTGADRGADLSMGGEQSARTQHQDRSQEDIDRYL